MKLFYAMVAIFLSCEYQYGWWLYLNPSEDARAICASIFLSVALILIGWSYDEAS